MKLFQSLIVLAILASILFKVRAEDLSWNVFPKGFSADYIETVQENSSALLIRKGKVFYSKDKCRFNISVDERNIDSIVRLDKNVRWFLLAEKNIYVEKPLSSDDALNHAALFEDWTGQKPESIEMYDQQKVGLYKHHTNNCDIKDYVSVQTGFPLKIDIACKGSTQYHRVLEFKNILDKEPDQSLFDIPDGYQKVSQ